MTTTTIATGALSTIGVALSAVNEEGNLTEDGKNNILGSTVTTTATTATIIGGTILNNQTMDRIYEKYATSYVESMSDEDLESALMQLDLLAAKMDENTNEKSI